MPRLLMAAVCLVFSPHMAFAGIIYSDLGGINNPDAGTSFQGTSQQEPLAITNTVPALTFTSSSGAPFVSPCGTAGSVPGLLASAVAGLYASTLGQNCTPTSVDTSYVMAFSGIVSEGSFGFWSFNANTPTAGTFDLMLGGVVQESVVLSGLLDASSGLSLYRNDSSVDSGWLLFQNTAFDSIRYTKPSNSQSWVAIDNVLWKFQTVTSVPEPGTLGLLGLGLGGIVFARRRREI